MTSNSPTVTARRARPLTGGVVLFAALALGASAHANDVTLKARYAISVGGIPIGHADATAKFRGDGTYAAAINGSTNGITRLVADARAVLAGAGHIVGPSVIPSSYNLATNEDGYETHVHMGMSGLSIVKLDARPGPKAGQERIPLTAANKRNVLDPVGAFMIALDRPDQLDGQNVCNRNLSIFDGWERFDVRLAYKETKRFTGGGSSYSGTVIACRAQYIPIAGHLKKGGNAEYLAGNNRLEVWLVPVKGTNLMVPIYFLIGTDYGDLVVRARSFKVITKEKRADAG